MKEREKINLAPTNNSHLTKRQAKKEQLNEFFINSNEDKKYFLDRKENTNKRNKYHKKLCYLAPVM